VFSQLGDRLFLFLCGFRPSRPVILLALQVFLLVRHPLTLLWGEPLPVPSVIVLALSLTHFLLFFWLKTHVFFFCFCTQKTNA